MTDESTFVHPGWSLTKREIEIMNMVADGMAHKEIAHVLGLSYRTVQVHTMSVAKKLDTHGGPGRLALWWAVERYKASGAVPAITSKVQFADIKVKP